MKARFSVSGMSCAMCAARVQKAVSALPGVRDCAVNLLKGEMAVTLDGPGAGPADVVAAVEKAGYGAAPLEAPARGGAARPASPTPAERAAREAAALRRRLGWSALFAVPLLYLSMGRPMGWPLPQGLLGAEGAISGRLARKVTGVSPSGFAHTGVFAGKWRPADFPGWY